VYLYYWERDNTMKKSELKEIIRKELELTEGLFMGPSKGKTKSKTVNVRHKTSGKELVIQDNPTNIKKYKRLGFIVYEATTCTIQEHDKAKVLKAMLKAGSNKADAQALLKKHYAYVDKKYRDESASKKAEIIVTLAGTASEGILTEKEAPYSEAELKQVHQFTARNDHILARHYIAKNGNYEKHRKAYQALHDLQSALGHSPNGVDKIITALDWELKKYIKKDVPNWQEVWKRL
jgi:hypothetical protein